jgi:hypothetical protein
MAALIILGGQSGVGKSTVYDRLMRQHHDVVFFRFFKKMKEMTTDLTLAERLETWGEIQNRLFNNEILPIVKNGINVLLETHFSFQRAGGIALAFAKRGFRESIPSSMTVSDSFLRLVAKNAVTVVPILVSANAQSIKQWILPYVMEESAIAKEGGWELTYFHKIVETLQACGSSVSPYHFHEIGLDNTTNHVSRIISQPW